MKTIKGMNELLKDPNGENVVKNTNGIVQTVKLKDAILMFLTSASFTDVKKDVIVYNLMVKMSSHTDDSILIEDAHYEVLIEAIKLNSPKMTAYTRGMIYSLLMKGDSL